MDNVIITVSGPNGVELFCTDKNICSVAQVIKDYNIFESDLVVTLKDCDVLKFINCPFSVRFIKSKS